MTLLSPTMEEEWDHHRRINMHISPSWGRSLEISHLSQGDGLREKGRYGNRIRIHWAVDLHGQQTVPATLGTVMSVHGKMASRSLFELPLHSEAWVGGKVERTFQVG